MGISAWIGYWLFEHILLGEHLAIRVLSAAAGMSIIYLFFIIVSGLIKKEELKRIPILRFLIPIK